MIKNARLTLGISGLAWAGLAAFSCAQGYRPAAGETVLMLEVQNKGSLAIRLHTKEAPRTTAHIIALVQKGFYTNQRFHKVERSPRPFLVQLGAPGSKDGNLDDPALRGQGSGARIPFEESGFRHDAEGVVGLSTQPGDRDSGDAQFYILLGPAQFLNGNYTVFGKVVSGNDVLRKIERGDRITSANIVRG